MTTGFIFQNASKGTISHLPQPSRSITIASQVWWTGCQPASANKRLNSIQTLAYFRITWAMHTVLSAIEALTCHPQLDLEVQGKVRQGTLHTDSWVWGAHPSSTPIKNICCLDTASRVDPISSVQDHTTVLQKFSTMYCVNILYFFYRNYKNIYFQYTFL